MKVKFKEKPVMCYCSKCCYLIASKECHENAKDCKCGEAGYYVKDYKEEEVKDARVEEY